MTGERLGNITLGAGGAFGWRGPDALRLWAHAGNTGLRAVAERAGLDRDPERDRRRGSRGSGGRVVAAVAVTAG
ncbi:hypothetical protein ACQP2X_20550 [Actinoplanes sp. CA-131856]